MSDAIAEFFRAVADYSLAGYAPRYEAMVRAAADDADVMDLVASAPPAAHAPHNLQAAARYVLLSGVDHPLAGAYEPGFDGDIGSLFCDLVLSHRAEVRELLSTRYVQTNEVNRTAAIAPLLNLVAQRENAPVALIDVGCSAGLNLLLDRYRIDVGDVSLGPVHARVLVTAQSRGRPAVADAADIRWRRGIDRNPIDVTDPEETRWLESLVWPDHPERLERLRAAIAVAQEHPPELVRADAVEGTVAALAEAPDDLLAIVVTTWVANFFDPDLRRDFEAVVVDADRPTAWLAMEMNGVVPDVDVPAEPEGQGEASVMTLVSAGAGRPVTREFLGFTHPHGSWVDFRT